MTEQAEPGTAAGSTARSSTGSSPTATIDTVLVVFPDLQGRLVGKRVTGHFFLRPRARGDGASRRATTSSRSTST